MMARAMAGVNIMNYSILVSELEQETGSLEDMHMFFVAFNQRQNKLLHVIEKKEMVQQSNDRSNLLFIGDEQGDEPDITRILSPEEEMFNQMNVILLRKEVDLE